MNHHIVLSLFHIFVVVPMLLYVAFVRGQMPPWVFPALLGLGGVILIYHMYRLIVKWKAASQSVWVNVIHVLFVAPLLLFIGTQAYDTPRWAYELPGVLDPAVPEFGRESWRSYPTCWVQGLHPGTSI